jgi:hypothetical protein
MNRRFVDYVSIAAAVISATIAFAASAFKLSEKLNFQELFFGVGSLLLIAILGALSLYIARGVKALTRRPRIFLSYSRDNAQQASMLREALTEKGAYVWFGETDLRPGDDLKATVEAAIESSNTVVLMLSRPAGPNVISELDAARARHVPILTVLGPNVEPPPEVRGSQAFALKADGSNIGEIATAAMQVR